MTFEEYWGEDPDPGKLTAKHAWNAGQKAEREKCAKLIEAAEAVVDDWYTKNFQISKLIEAAEAVVDDWYTKNFQIRTSTVEKLCELIERFKNEN